MNTPYYTAQSVSSHMARSYRNILRYDAESGEFQELHGQWIEIDEVRLEGYIRAAICTLLGHAMNIGREASDELHALDTDAGYYEIGKLAAQELRFPPMVEEEPEVEEEV